MSAPNAVSANSKIPLDPPPNNLSQQMVQTADATRRTFMEFGKVLVCLNDICSVEKGGERLGTGEYAYIIQIQYFHNKAQKLVYDHSYGNTERRLAVRDREYSIIRNFLMPPNVSRSS